MRLAPSEKYTGSAVIKSIRPKDKSTFLVKEKINDPKSKTISTSTKYDRNIGFKLTLLPKTMNHG